MNTIKTICGTCSNRINGKCTVGESVYSTVGYNFTGCEGEYYEDNKGELNERNGYHVCPTDCAF